MPQAEAQEEKRLPCPVVYMTAASFASCYLGQMS